MKSRGFSESHSIPYGKVRILGFLEAPLIRQRVIREVKRRQGRPPFFLGELPFERGATSPAAAI
jgi:hypothetical protein